PDPGARVARDLARVEVVERSAVGRALPQDRRPRQARLGALEDEALEESAVVAHGHTPLAVVIADVERALGPAAAPACSDHRAQRRTLGPPPSTSSTSRGEMIATSPQIEHLSAATAVAVSTVSSRSQPRCAAHRKPAT